ncbi:MAG: mercuric transporter MerT family protein [Xanthomonadales bacterium]
MNSIEKSSANKADRTTAVTTGGAIGISAFASFIGLCCIGPWAVALFGVSGAITMARWAPVRPYILVVASVMLAWAFWRVYRPRPVCADDTCPASPSVWLKLTLWVAVVLVGLAFFADELQWLLVDPTPAGLRE